VKSKDVRVRQLWLGLVLMVTLPSTTLAQQESSLTDNNPSRSVARDESDHISPHAMIFDTKSDYVIGNGDVLAINVWKEPEVSRTLPVRADGKISLPLLGEIQAAGKTPNQLQNDISKGLHDYIAEPEVTVIVQEQKSERFNILGQVQKPGSYLLNPPLRVMDAIAIAGGLRDFAKAKSIRILRPQQNGEQSSFSFNYKQAVSGTNPTQNIEIQPGDTIYVP
jgi:polysaccharide biosynthesis/export protein